MPFRETRLGFTLAELLIALAILGAIATFTIPKIVSSQANTKKIAVFKETISALNAAFVPACIQGQITENNVGSFLRSNLNYVKSCTDSMNEGCWYGTDLVGQGHTEGIILHNGAVIAGLDDAAGATGQDTLMIDWDGAAGANTHANDQLVVKAIITNATSTDRVCSIRWDTAHTASGALWNQIFQ